MSKFAKLFDVEDTQVLFLLSEVNSSPAVQIITEVEGMNVSVSVEFANMDTDLAWKKAEEMLLNSTQDTANKFYSEMKQKLFGAAH